MALARRKRYAVLRLLYDMARSRYKQIACFAPRHKLNQSAEFLIWIRQNDTPTHKVWGTRHGEKHAYVIDIYSDCSFVYATDLLGLPPREQRQVANPHSERVARMDVVVLDIAGSMGAHNRRNLNLVFRKLHGYPRMPGYHSQTSPTVSERISYCVLQPARETHQCAPARHTNPR